ncbi:hydroxyisourate hydrolase [Rhodococcus sp. HNM0569]|uniref:hydroxyisourate hydrolase n=1 Tax=Rhodococcus sp. HNM0569 TaxID=2716340 RepID=UPI00146EF3D3|nr:hydroxyisourate hydrolase [Rhodococcus sp. HNM0569]NLU82162.1 hydroxyisourate hydrolase [Rhodococcus sp. HNM0569]
MSTTLSTHVLDATLGGPAVGVTVRLEDSTGAALATHRTDDDGRIGSFVADPLTEGTYRLVFDSGGFFSAQGREHFYPEVVVVFRVDGSGRGYHVPILLSPFAYTTYRGS